MLELRYGFGGGGAEWESQVYVVVGMVVVMRVEQVQWVGGG